MLREENFLTLKYGDTDAEQAAGTLNALITRYVDEAATQKRQKLTLLAGVLDSQVIDQASKLRNAEQSLEGFRVGTVTELREDAPVTPGLQLTQPTVYTQYFGMRNELEALRLDRRAIEEVMSRARTGAMAVDAFNTIPAVGSGIVWFPAAIWLMAFGEVGKGIALIVFGALVIGMADNVLRPMLLSGRTSLHGLLVFVS